MWWALELLDIARSLPKELFACQHLDLITVQSSILAVQHLVRGITFAIVTPLPWNLQQPGNQNKRVGSPIEGDKKRWNL